MQFTVHLRSSGAHQIKRFQWFHSSVKLQSTISEKNETKKNDEKSSISNKWASGGGTVKRKNGSPQPQQWKWAEEKKKMIIDADSMRGQPFLFPHMIYHCSTHTHVRPIRFRPKMSRNRLMALSAAAVNDLWSTTIRNGARENHNCNQTLVSKGKRDAHLMVNSHWLNSKWKQR